MADRGIIFSAAMVRALLDGRKTQTRRLLKSVPEGARYSGIHYASDEPDSWFFNSPRGPRKLRVSFEPGDRLYVREAWKVEARYDDVKGSDLPRTAPIYHLECPGEPTPECAGRYRQGRFMPRWASRLWLSVTDVRVQRVQEISEADAIAEGLEWIAPGKWSVAPHMPIIGDDPRKVFSELWNSLHTKPGETWADNPWIVAVSFTVNHGNIDTNSARAIPVPRKGPDGSNVVRHDS